MKKVTIYYRNAVVAMIKVKASFDVAEIQAENQKQHLVLRFKCNLSELSYSIN